MTEKHIDEISGTETTGHEWDGIKELNTPLPRWWLWTFYGTIVWALGYTIAYPAWPMISEATSGMLGYSSRGDLANEVAAVDAARAGTYDRIAQMDVADVLANEELARFARSGGASLFKVNCSQCHGSGAQGSVGYPNLNDDAWIWGGTIKDIYLTIAHGVRFEQDPDTRFNEMPAFGDGILDREQILSIAGYVAGLTDIETSLPTTAEGQTLFAENCAACHGENAEGVAELGGPALNDAIWLYPADIDSIITQISQPRHGVMPGWNAKLGDAAVKQLAVYVYSLGGGQ